MKIIKDRNLIIVVGSAVIYFGREDIDVREKRNHIEYMRGYFSIDEDI